MTGRRTFAARPAAYLWCNGCGPTSAGMVIGYWDGQGFDDLVPGDASMQTAEVNQMMSSTGNYDDYCLPIDLYPNTLDDRSEPPAGDEHPDDDLPADAPEHFLRYLDHSLAGHQQGLPRHYLRERVV